MRRVVVLFIGLLLLYSAAFAANVDACRFRMNNGLNCIDNVSIQYRHGTVFITPEYDNEDGEVEITRDYELYVNGRRIRLNKEQEELAADYHETVRSIYKEAVNIGWEGAKIGAEGTALGIKAVVGVFRLLSPDYDEDDLERDLEREAEKLEEKAEDLEEVAEEIEDMTDDLKYAHRKMRGEIKELRQLRWF